MDIRPGVLQPAEIELLKSMLDDAAAMVPHEQRSPGFEERLAQRILAGTAGRSHDPMNLQMVALLALGDALKVPTTYR
jgi:hypothetical protein